MLFSFQFKDKSKKQENYFRKQVTTIILNKQKGLLKKMSLKQKKRNM